jgi:predicted nucleotidyltransferase
MQIKNITEIINSLKQKIASEFNDFKGLYLYGSFAKGNFTEESDIDIIVLFSEKLTYEDERKLAGIIGLVEYENDVFVDYHPYTMNDLKKNPIFLDEVVEKGIYYEAA